MIEGNKQYGLVPETIFYCTECHYNGIHFHLKQPIAFTMEGMAYGVVCYTNKEFNLIIETPSFPEFKNKLGELIWFSWMKPDKGKFHNFLKNNLFDPKVERHWGNYSSP